MNCFLNFDNYWHPNYKGIAGYATLPTSAEKVPDRFYDENGWTAIGLCDAYLATQNKSYLEKAKGALAFSLSGEDNVLGGGIYFQETFVSLPVQKNTICSAVTMLSCMKLYEITQDRQYQIGRAQSELQSPEAISYAVFCLKKKKKNKKIQQ